MEAIQDWAVEKAFGRAMNEAACWIYMNNLKVHMISLFRQKEYHFNIVLSLSQGTWSAWC
jgi:hypothetical protein